jgi:predicted nucleotidyltransferase
MMSDNLLGSGLFSNTRQAVLALLYGQPDCSFYTLQIVGTAKTGRGAVQRELKTLTGAGIILREVQGRQVYYRANQNCPIFSELKSLVLKTFGVAEIIREALQPAAKDIQSAFIFGSMAAGKDRKSSDVDLMIVGDISFAKIVALLAPAEAKIGRELNTIVYPATEFQQKVKTDHYFVKNVMDSEKIFIIGDENGLNRLAE